MRINWKSLKKFIDDTGLYHFINYLEFDNETFVWVSYQNQNFDCLLSKGSQDFADFETSYKNKAVLKDDMTSDGITINKVEYVLKGRFLSALYTVFNSSRKETNDATGFFSIKLFDELGFETQIGNDAVKTCLDFRPNYAYELFSGGLQMPVTTPHVFFISAIWAPEIPSEQGGHRYFVRNRRILQSGDYCVEAVGPGSIPYDPSIPINVLRIELSHDKGIVQEFQNELKIYV